MPNRSERRRSMRAELAWAVGTAVATLVLAALALHLWDASSLHVPFEYTSDGNQNQVFIKGLLDHGWYQHNPSLGAPFGQTLYDFPVVSGDNLQMVLMKGLGVFSSDSAWVMNVFFLLTFPLTALTAFLAARLLGLARPSAALLAGLFALLPYHFLRGEMHLFIGAYYAVPLGAWLAVTAMAGNGIFGWWPAGDVRRRRGRIALVALAIVVIGSAHVYYAAFTGALLVIAAATRLVARTPRAAAMALVCAAAIGVVVAANHLPNALYRADHGVNHSLERPAAESETYGLKIAAMALPVPGHRLAPLARLRDRYDTTTGDQIGEGSPQALGTLATLGVAGLLLVALAALGGTGARRPRPLVLALAATTLAAILLGTIGGLSSVFAYLATPQLRSWARISVFIGFFGLTAVVLAGEWFRARRGQRAWIAALATVAVVGVLDQTNGSMVPPYSRTQVTYESDRTFVNQIEKTLGPGKAVFEFPYEPFPEPQPSYLPLIGTYEMGRPYLHSQHLRWSWGLMKGRAGDWETALVQLPPALAARALVAAGFEGIYIDKPGYVDGGQQLLDALTHETGTQPSNSPDGRLAFIDLRDYARRLRSAHPSELAALRSAVLRPVSLEPGPGLSTRRQDASSLYFLAEQDAKLVIRNSRERPRSVTVAMRLERAAPAPTTVDIRWPDGATERVRVPASGADVRRRFVAPAGASTIGLHTNGSAQLSLPQVPRPYYLRVLDPMVIDSAFEPFGPLPRDPHAAASLSPFGKI